MATIKAKAYIPSAGEYDALKEKFPAFASARLRKEAKIQGAWIAKGDFKCNGIFLLRTPLSSSSFKVCYGDSSGVRDWYWTSYIDAGLRVALPLIYNPKSSLVKGCRKVKRTTKIWDEEKNEAVNVTSTAPVVNYGGNDYIWTNREDCKNGTSNVMSCVSIKLLEKAQPFDEDGDHNDYAKADELRAQCERVAFENASEEEKAMAIEVEMSSEDDYEELKYCFTQKQLKMLDEIKKFQDDCARKLENDIRRSQDGQENGDGDESEIQ